MPFITIGLALMPFSKKPPRELYFEGKLSAPGSRKIATPMPKRDAAGKKLCKWCWKDPGSSRREWCPPCVEEYNGLAQPGRIRMTIFKRDQGICQLCGIDTAAIEAKPWEHTFEVDHIVPICEGGNSDEKNLRTLCIPCHRTESALLAARSAAKRKAQKG